MAVIELPNATPTELLDELCGELGRVVGAIDPATVTTAHAADLLGKLARIERIAAGGRTLIAERAAESDRWKVAGKKSPEDWLADETGASKSDVKRGLKTSRQIQGLDQTRRALATGDLSARQAELVAGAAAANPEAEGGLLATAAAEPLAALAESAGRVRAAADPDPEATRRRHHRQRELRFYDGPDGERRASLGGPRDQMARVQARVDAELDTILGRAREDGVREGLEAYTFDAFLVALGLDPALDPVETSEPEPGEAGRAVGRGPRRPERDTLIVHASLQPLLTGAMGDDDFCEIPGVGPYPLPAAQEMLWGDSAVHLVVEYGTDVRNVVTNTRAIRLSIETAVLARDRGRCVIAGCGRRAVEIHHLGGARGFATTGVTTLDLLASLCAHHHDDLTHRGAELTGSHQHGWQWRPPPIERAHPQGRPSRSYEKRERARRRRARQ